MKRITPILASMALLAFAAAPAFAAEQKATGTKESPASRKTETAKPAAQGHPGQGTVNSVDAKAGKVNLTHGPVPTLNWPGMTMDFPVADKQALAKLKPGQKVDFKVVEKSRGQFVIGEIAPAK